ncbi:glycosyltransferase family 2 protein [Parabacteroides sp. FAFU027]|uniref:glycosyltransferase family 2 protein n=1 Tax=Parabacteroides sp. FAFU027 TaxID=2922715 RepID=UPI001FAF53BA|nr:glycosyltransferase family 2 protein [Parabacteroides sp. FAFU027]
MRPLFSIITVTFNAEAFVEKTILSVLGQTYPDIEYILIDGASTDGTMEIVKKYKDHPHFVWKSEPDNGLYDAMNKAMKLATGDYIWFINAGDTLHSLTTVEQLAESIPGKLLPDVIYGETAIIDETGKKLGMRRLKTPERLTWKSFRMGMLVCHQSFMVRPNLAPEFDLTYSRSSDFDWCVNCLKGADDIYNSHMILSNFLQGGMSTTQRKESLKERFQIMKKHYGIVPVTLLHLWFAIRFYFAKMARGQVD